MNQLASESTEPVSPSYRRFALAMLTVVYAFNFIDRQILVILQESIKADMGLSDTQLGLLTGFAFALFYVSFGLPIARWADQGNRRNIISLALALWSGMTAISGLVQNYWQLLLARMGVGIGEAGGSPPAHSMISDYFPPQERATALSIYSMGIYFGILIGYLLGGWINETFGWRIAFFVVGLPGVAFAILLRLTLKEPPRGHWEEAQQAAEKPSIAQAFKVMLSNRAFIALSLGCALVSFVAYGNGNFMPSYLYRSHQMNFAEIGLALALVQGIGGAAGTFLGGWITDRMIKTDRRYYLWVPALASLIAIPFAYWGYLQTSTIGALSAFAVWVVFGAMYLGPALAVSHTMVVPKMRALVSAVLFFILNLIGLGLGPVTTGFLSDSLKPDWSASGLAQNNGWLFQLFQPGSDAEALRIAMMLTQSVAVVGVILFALGGFWLKGYLPPKAVTQTRY